MSLALARLSFSTFPGKDPERAGSRLYESAYRLWCRVWSQTFLELDGNATVYSDDFCRQDAVCALSVDDECVALAFMNQVDFSQGPPRNDSYFRAWSAEAIEKLTKDGPRIVIGSNITVDPAHRGDLGDGVSLKNLLLGLVTRRMLELEVDAMTGTMRCNRGMHRSAYNLGAEPIQTGVIYHGVPVDLVAFYRRAIARARLLDGELAVQSLWSRRQVYTRSAKASQPDRKAA